MGFKYFEPGRECQASHRRESAHEAEIGPGQKSAKKVGFLFAFRPIAVNIAER
jgi:hypothetical protein